MKELEDDRIQKALEREVLINQNLFLISAIYQYGYDIKSFLEMQQINRFVVYGLGKVGKAFLGLLETQKDIEVLCAVDKNKNIKADGIKTVHTIEEIPRDIDAVIITSDFYFSDIVNSINKSLKTEEKIRCILLHDLIEGIALMPIPIK